MKVSLKITCAGLQIEDRVPVILDNVSIQQFVEQLADGELDELLRVATAELEEREEIARV